MGNVFEVRHCSASVCFGVGVERREGLKNSGWEALSSVFSQTICWKLDLEMNTLTTGKGTHLLGSFSIFIHQNTC